MKAIRFLNLLPAVTFGLSVLSATFALGADTKPVAVIQSTINGYILPAHQQFNSSALAMHEAVDALCKTPAAEQMQTVRSAFGKIISHWSAIDIIRIGPILQDNRLERLVFFPDRRGIGLRQIQKLLASEDPALTDANTLAGKSVAIQGLSALEFALFGKGASELTQRSASFRCHYALAISENISAIASQLLGAWKMSDGISSEWQNPGPENRLYRNPSESLSALVSLFANGLAYYDTVELSAFLGITADNDKPRAALFRRSNNAVRVIQHGFMNFDRMYKQSGLQDSVSQEDKWITDAIHFGFRHGGTSLQSLDGTVLDVLSDPQQRAKLDYVRTVVRALGENFGVDLTTALGLTANFSSLDGD